MAAVTVSVDTRALSRALSRFERSTLPAARDTAARLVLFEVLAEVVETVPVDTGRLRAGYRGTIEVTEEGDMTVASLTNPVEYAAAVEYGTATRPPGNHVATAVENASRRLSTPSGARAIAEAVAEAWEDAT